MFIPTTPEELTQLGWHTLDVILVSGDSYIDHAMMGIALIGKLLLRAGYRVGIIAQPDIAKPDDIMRLGEPTLFWGVTAGSVDSMVANFTATGKPRHEDDYTPGGINNRRPNRAVIAYANLIRRYFKPTAPIVLGGLEASLRRLAHYDFWQNQIRRSVLLDAKADYLLYGMAESAILALADALKQGKPVEDIRGLCYATNTPPTHYLTLPTYEQVSTDGDAFIKMFHQFYHNSSALNAQGLVQAHANRFVVQNPPALPLSTTEMDVIYTLPFERAQHPYYEAQGKVKALETIRFSVPTHRGCYGECNFCSIAVHEGRTVQWRSQASIINEVTAITHIPGFKGIIQDLSAPTANMYGFECAVKIKKGACKDKRCLHPQICPALKIDHHPQTTLLKALRAIPGIRKVFISSGLRHDMILADAKSGKPYLETLLAHHVSGQLKLAPEHSTPRVLTLMGKNSAADLLAFKTQFDALNQTLQKKQYLTYYFIAAHPGCSELEMRQLKQFISQHLHITPEQVQIFTPTPSTYASLMYVTEKDPFTGEKIFVEKNPAAKQRQKAIISPPKRLK